ncbi:MAG: hypothetical protein DWI58_13620 [Chloroflexi bacterium]|nr:MAG: hypothetical protein DWI58_13620 [Chloroflexota bacterium]
MNSELAGMLFVMTGFAIIATGITIIVRQGMVMEQDRRKTAATVSEQHEYRRLAEESATAQRETAQALTRLEDVERRLAAVERMLREVDEPVLAR